MKEKRTSSATTTTPVSKKKKKNTTTTTITTTTTKIESSQKPQQTTVVGEIGENDVLSGRGGGSNNHVGNRRFRLLVAEHQQEYLHAGKLDKAVIANRIVSIVHDKGGRFLKRVNDKEWIELSEIKAREKTGQCLREGLNVRHNTIRTDHKMKIEPSKLQQQQNVVVQTMTELPNTSNKKE